MRTEYRIRFVEDPDAQFEECNGEARSLTEDEYRENEYMKDGQPIPYEEYLRYYGNPDRHVYLLAEAQAKCPCCGAWQTKGCLGSIDFMDDAPELRAVAGETWFTPEQAERLPGYARETALEVLQEARYRQTPA